ncbi:MAG: hypothetical protein J6U04_04140 [Salinivirgaceae bacterium]|nr:hypothetical protein [Salinivirgaceae bacterium]
MFRISLTAKAISSFALIVIPANKNPHNWRLTAVGFPIFFATRFRGSRMPSTASVVIAAKILLIKVRERQRGEGAAFFVPDIKELTIVPNPQKKSPPTNADGDFFC